MKTKFFQIIFLSISLFVFILSNLCLAADTDALTLPQFYSSFGSVIDLWLGASSFSGEAHTSLPIEMPASAGNIASKISVVLNYRSNGDNSWVGRGWELELGTIAKINKFGAKNTNNPYALTLNGSSYELVSIDTNKYRTKIESHKRIEFDGSKWNVWEKDGTLYQFGLNAVGKWFLTKVTNTHGISLRIEYDNPNSEEIYLKQIVYPEGQGLTAVCKIIFTSENREDKLISYYYGVPQRINKRLKEVQVVVEQTVQKKYCLAYSTNGASLVSLLTKVTTYGKDGIAFPPVTFSYQGTLKTNIFNSQNEWATVTGKFYSNNAAGGPDYSYMPPSMDVAMIDLDKDSLPDFIGCKYEYKQNGYKAIWSVRRNTGKGLSSTEEIWLTMESKDQTTLSRRATLADMNKDGRPDLVYTRQEGNDGTGKADSVYVRYNEGNKFSATETKLIDYTQMYYHTEDANAVRAITLGQTAMFTDLNGDALPDLVYTKVRHWVTKTIHDIAYITVKYELFDFVVRLNTGNGFSTQEKIWLTNTKTGNSNWDVSDGTYFRYAYYPFTQGGMTTNKSYRAELICFNKNMTFADMNGDGLLDFVYNDFAGTVSVADGTSRRYFPSYNWKVRYNTGEKFSDTAELFLANAPVYLYRNDPNGTQFLYDGTSVHLNENGILADINSDGLPDLIANQYIDDMSNGTYSIKAPWRVFFNTGSKFTGSVALLNSIDYDFQLGSKTSHAKTLNYSSYFMDLDNDGVTDFVYPRFVKLTNYLNSYPEITFKLVCASNKQVFPSDLLTSFTGSYGGKTSLAYSTSANFDNTGDDSAADLPFSLPVVKTITRDPGIGSVGVTSYNYEGGLYDSASREFRGFQHVETTDPLGYVSHAYFHQSESKLGKPEKDQNDITTTLYTYKDDTTAPYFTPLIQTEEYTNSKNRRTAYEYDDYGNAVKTINYGDTAVSGDEKSIFTEYAINASSWLISFPSRQRIFSGTEASGSPISEARYFYDNNSNYTDTPVKGDLTKTGHYLNTTGGYIYTSSGYDNLGNTISTTDAKGYVTSIIYDSLYHFLPVSVKNAKAQIEQTSYYQPADAKGLFGQIKSKTDTNGNQINFEYDGFGRKTKVIGPYDLSSPYGSESYAYAVSAPGASYIFTQTTEENGTTANFAKIDILDGFERVVQSSQEAEVSQVCAYVTTQYNSRGEKSNVSLPYFEDGGIKGGYSIPQGQVYWTNYTYDALGRLTRIDKPDATAIVTDYDGWSTTVTDENNHKKILNNDAYGRLASVKEKNGLEEYLTSYTYNALNNLILVLDSANNRFEFVYDSLGRKTKMFDPDLGVWEYSYDDNHNLIKTKDGNGNTINYAYDELNRLTTKDYASQTGVEITYLYDDTTSPNGIGRRTGMKDLSGESRWNYDKEGRIIKLSKKVDADTYDIAWTYDAMDRVKSMLFPNGERVDFTFNNAGLMESIPGFINDVNYNASRQPTELVYMNPITSRFDYYPDDLRLKSIISGSLQDLSYEYDKTGNVIKISDRAHSLIKDYLYDDLNRLVSGDGNAYEYNPIGNLVKANGIVQQYSSSKKHALTHDGANSYSYDNCGNMISGAGRSIVYDAENRPVKITKNDVVTEFFYDGDGKRVKKRVAENAIVTNTVYVENLYEKETVED